MSDIEQIQRYLPHRYPFLLVDRVIAQDRVSVRAIKNVTINEPFFQGHFPGYAVMPGVLVLEAMAQTAALLFPLICGEEEAGGQIFLLAGIDKVRFRRQVRPGEQLVLESRLLSRRKTMLRLACSAKVNEALVAETVILATVTDKES